MFLKSVVCFTRTAHLSVDQPRFKFLGLRVGSGHCIGQCTTRVSRSFLSLLLLFATFLVSFALRTFSKSACTLIICQAFSGCLGNS